MACIKIQQRLKRFQRSGAVKHQRAERHTSVIFVE